MNFERSTNPKETLGIGVFSHRTFPTDIVGAMVIVPMIPAIIKTKRIPRDILNKPRGTFGINKKYEKTISDYTAKFIHIEEAFSFPEGVPDASLLWSVVDYLKFLDNKRKDEFRKKRKSPKKP